ncbi:MAG: hypothetical protein AB2544_20040 [Candidatus Thiodiazotropha endolucinida]
MQHSACLYVIRHGADQHRLEKDTVQAIDVITLQIYIRLQYRHFRRVDINPGP